MRRIFQLRTPPKEAALYLALFALSCLTYFTISQVVTNPTEVFMPNWVPFVPALALPYLLQVVVSYVLALAIEDAPRRRAVFYAYFAAFGVTCLVWYLHPTIMHRPEAVPTWYNWLYVRMVGMDAPVNVVPAGHILMPVLIIWAFWHDRPSWLWWLVPAEAVGMVGIVTTWQHRPLDVLMGILMSLAWGFVFGVGRRQETPARVSAAEEGAPA